MRNDCRAFFLLYRYLCCSWETHGPKRSIAVSIFPLRWLSRSISVGYLMSAPATVASMIKVPKFESEIVISGITSALPPPPDPFPEWSSFLSTSRISSGHFPVQMYSSTLAQTLLGITFGNVPSWMERTEAPCEIRAFPNNAERTDFPGCTGLCPHRLICQTAADWLLQKQCMSCFLRHGLQIVVLYAIPRRGFHKLDQSVFGIQFSSKGKEKTFYCQLLIFCPYSICSHSIITCKLKILPVLTDFVIPCSVLFVINYS